jgi:hypothetical protein
MIIPLYVADDDLEFVKWLDAESQKIKSSRSSFIRMVLCMYRDIGDKVTTDSLYGSERASVAFNGNKGRVGIPENKNKAIQGFSGFIKK